MLKYVRFSAAQLQVFLTSFFSTIWTQHSILRNSLINAETKMANRIIAEQFTQDQSDWAELMIAHAFPYVIFINFTPCKNETHFVKQKREEQIFSIH